MSIAAGTVAPVAFLAAARGFVRYDRKKMEPRRGGVPRMDRWPVRLVLSLLLVSAAWPAAAAGVRIHRAEELTLSAKSLPTASELAKDSAARTSPAMRSLRSDAASRWNSQTTRTWSRSCRKRAGARCCSAASFSRVACPGKRNPGSASRASGTTSMESSSTAGNSSCSLPRTRSRCCSTRALTRAPRSQR